MSTLVHARSSPVDSELPKARVRALSHGDLHSRFRGVNFALSRKQKFIIAGAILVPVIVFGLYTWAALTWSYSRGERAGYVQKFSRKGWGCKTWAGEPALLAIPCTMSEKFCF